MNKDDRQERIEQLIAMLDKIFKDENFDAAAKAAAASLSKKGVTEGRGYTISLIAIQAVQFPNSF